MCIRDSFHAGDLDVTIHRLRCARTAVLAAQPLPRHAEHQFDAVFLVDPGGTGVVVDGGDVCVGIDGADLVDHALAADVVGQAAEGLGADNVLKALSLIQIYGCVQLSVRKHSEHVAK